MEVSITAAKPQTLAAAASVPLSSPQFHLASSIRREFLGCGTHLRPPPPGLRSRLSRKKLGLRAQSPRCLLNDPADDDLVRLVAAATVATLATLQLVNLNYRRGKHKEPKFADDKKADAIASSDLCKMNIDTLECEAVGNQLLTSEGLCLQPFKEENVLEGPYENMDKKALDSGLKDATQQEFQKAVLIPDEVLISGVKPDYGLVSSPTENELLKINDLTGSNSSSPRDSEFLKRNDFKAEGASFPSETPIFLFKEEAGAVSSFPPSIEGKVRKINQENELGHIGTEHTEFFITSYDRHIIEPAEDVSICDSEVPPVVRSISHLKRLTTKPQHLTSHEGVVSLPKTDMVPKDVHAKRSSRSAETQIGSLKENPMSEENVSTDVHCFRRDTGRTIAHNNTNNKETSVLPRQNSIAEGVNGLTTYLRTYNRLLRDGRLRDCVDLLEEMEKKGLLDMEKVHHTKFFKACKSKKAVKEAFRFCKLIPKATLSTFNMLLSVCASSQDFEGAFEAMLLVKEAGLIPDCKLYTTLISTCAKSGKVDAMFEVFHEMVNTGLEPNINTYGALIDGCARAGQVAKAFGAYGIMRSKNVQPDRVIFNALITACGQSGAVDRAFDVLAEMRAEPKPVDPDHVTVGALIRTCSKAGQVDRVPEVYEMLRSYNIKGNPDVYTIAINSCSQTGDLEFALSIYSDMKKNGVVPDEMFLSTLIDVAGHAGKVDSAFNILQDARSLGIRLGNVTYSSLMGACCNAKNWQKALELYEEIKAIRLLPTVSTLNALVTSLCDGDQLLKSAEVLNEMKELGVKPNIITYSVLIVACERKDEAELGFSLLSEAKTDGILPNLIMCRCLTGLCLKSLEKAYSIGEPIVTFSSGRPQIDSHWASRAIMVYHEAVSAGVVPTIEVFSQVLGCLHYPRDSSLRSRFAENSGIVVDPSRHTNVCSLLDGFGEYDTRSFSVLEEAMSLGVIPHVLIKDGPIVVDARRLLIHTVEVCLLSILKGLKYRLAAGARLPNITIILPTEKIQIESSSGGRRPINVAGRTGQAVGSLLRRLGLQYSGHESNGRIRINGLALRRWLKPKLSEHSSGRTGEMTFSPTRLSKGIFYQQRNIRSTNLSLD